MNTVIAILVLFAAWDILSRILNADAPERAASKAETERLIASAEKTIRESRERRLDLGR